LSDLRQEEGLYYKLGTLELEKARNIVKRNWSYPRRNRIPQRAAMTIQLPDHQYGIGGAGFLSTGEAGEFMMNWTRQKLKKGHCSP